MNLQDLTKQIELAQVNNEFGWGEFISYTHRASSYTIQVKAMVLGGFYLEKESPETLYDGTSFMSVELSTRPLKGDIIQWDNLTWYVESFSQGARGVYDLYCTADKHHQKKRSGRRTT